MGIPVKDWDLEVFNLEPRQVERLLRKRGAVHLVGRSFGVYKWSLHGLEIDVSIPRKDNASGLPNSMDSVPTLTPVEAARRRDLTLNAILYDPIAEAYLDPFSGIEDLQNRILRPVDPQRFLEDPLRAIRAVQFSARLSCHPAPELDTLCTKAPLDELPAERISTEWQKLLLLSPSPSVGFSMARRWNILNRVFPEAAPHCSEEADLALDRLASRGREGLLPYGRRLAAMIATWLHRCPTQAIEATLDRLWLHTVDGYPLRDRVLKAVTRWSQVPKSDSGLKHLSTVTEMELTCWVAWAVTEDPSLIQCLHRCEELHILHDAPEPVLKGRDLLALGYTPGPALGELLRTVYQRQLDGDVQTKAEGLTLIEEQHPTHSKKESDSTPP